MIRISKKLADLQKMRKNIKSGSAKSGISYDDPCKHYHVAYENCKDSVTDKSKEEEERMKLRVQEKIRQQFDPKNWGSRETLRRG